MKVLTVLSTIFILAFTSCNKWLDVTPQDTVVEDQLFATGDGYRNTLNGIYKQMATPSMYGKELSWGMLDVMGQLYRHQGFPNSSSYKKIVRTYSYDDRNVSPLIESIWSNAYNSIANCNSLLAKIDGTDSTLFRGLQNEKMLIKGEALALRAFLHFDMLRLFAPAPVANASTPDANLYIPYFKVYPSTFEPNRTVKEILDFVVEDLLTAKNLVAPHDTIAWRVMLGQFRIDYRGSNSEMNPDLFFKHRGFRMNYLAISALLARVYNYTGEIDNTCYQKSYDMAEHVITLKVDDWGSTLKFTPYYYASENRKLYDGVIFCLSNQKLLEDYQHMDQDNSMNFYLQTPATMFDDNSDIRKVDLTEASGRYQICLKNIAPKGAIGDYEYCQDMLPMIRLSEMYYIQAEHLCRQGNIAGAVEKIDKVRKARNCQIGNFGEMAKKITDLASFKKEMVKEAARDFMQEGQVFYYYKRFNLLPKSGMNAASMVLPKPKNETIH